jgi:hypothetical protein
MLRPKSIAATLVLGVMLQACATGADRESKSIEQMLADKGYRMGDEIQTIRQFSFNGWTELDELHLILHSRVSDRYLVTLATLCDGLRSSARIALSNTAGQFSKFDYVTVSGGPPGVNRRCNVRALHELERIESDTQKD